MTLGKYLKNRREELNLTQDFVANYVGVPKGTISKWENDRVSEITRSNIKKLSEVLKIDPVEIIYWDDNRSNTEIPIKKEIDNLVTNILNKTDDISKLELLKKVLISFDD